MEEIAERIFERSTILFFFSRLTKHTPDSGVSYSSNKKRGQ